MVSRKEASSFHLGLTNQPTPQRRVHYQCTGFHMYEPNVDFEKIHVVRNHLGTIKSEARKHMPRLGKLCQGREEIWSKEGIYLSVKHSLCACCRSDSARGLRNTMVNIINEVFVLPDLPCQWGYRQVKTELQQSEGATMDHSYGSTWKHLRQTLVGGEGDGSSVGDGGGVEHITLLQTYAFPSSVPEDSFPGKKGTLPSITVYKIVMLPYGCTDVSVTNKEMPVY